MDNSVPFEVYKKTMLLNVLENEMDSAYEKSELLSCDVYSEWGDKIREIHNKIKKEIDEESEGIYDMYTNNIMCMLGWKPELKSWVEMMGLTHDILETVGKRSEQDLSVLLETITDIKKFLESGHSTRL